MMTYHDEYDMPSGSMMMDMPIICVYDMYQDDVMNRCPITLFVGVMSE